jgi:Xaa-Pro dipeptidase
MPRLLHERPHLLDGTRREERRERPPQRQVIGAVDFTDAEWWLAVGTRNTHPALVIHTVGGVRFVPVRKGVAVARDMEAALAPGITERELLGIYHERIASLGAPMPPSEGVCFTAPPSGPVGFRHLASDRPVGDGELVVLAPGALYAGYEAGLARTRVAGTAAPPGAGELASRCARGMDALIAACRAGNTGADLYRAWEDTGDPDPAIPLAHGLGLGAEPPLIGMGRGSDAAIDEGMVLSVQSWVTEEGVGGCLERATVHIGSRGPSVLTRYGRL